MVQAKSYETASGIIRYWVDAAAGAEAPSSAEANLRTNEMQDVLPGASVLPRSTSGAPWLVFLPGLTADHRLFDKQMEHFSGRVNCLVWDPPAHGESRPYPLDFTMDDLAGMVHGILNAEGIERPVLVGQSMGGYVSQAFIDLYPGQAAGFISIDSAPLKRKYYPNWEVWALRHTRGMYASIPWTILRPWGAKGAAETEYGQSLMYAFMDIYTKHEYVDLAAHGYRILADAIEANRAYNIDCPALLLCGEKDHAGDVRPFNRKWSAGENLPLVWVPGAGHNSNTDAPGFVNAQIERFLETLS